jgi:hypothetical protein
MPCGARLISSTGIDCLATSAPLAFVRLLATCGVDPRDGGARDWQIDRPRPRNRAVARERQNRIVALSLATCRFEARAQRRVCLPRYYFTILWADHEDIDSQGAQLADDRAALGYACHLVDRLRASGGYSDPRLAIEVRNEMRQRVLSIPFLPGCA